MLDGTTDADGDGHYAIGSCATPAADCNDNDNTIYPGAPEICDGKDNDCDTVIDDGLSFTTYYLDNDNDTYGDINNSTSTCDGPPTGYVVNSTDCDDSDPNINPGVDEVPNNDIDEDCDGEALNIDNDMDGFNSDEDCDDSNPNYLGRIISNS